MSFKGRTNGFEPGNDSSILSIPAEDNSMDIDEKHDLTHITEEEYLEKIRHAEQLSSCPCTECTARCWSTNEFEDCQPYRDWWNLQNGVKR